MPALLLDDVPEELYRRLEQWQLPSGCRSPRRRFACYDKRSA